MDDGTVEYEVESILKHRVRNKYMDEAHVWNI